MASRLPLSFLPLAAFLVAGCGGLRQEQPESGTPGSPEAFEAAAPVITDAAVVAFWRRTADTIAAEARSRVLREFSRSNHAIERYLSDTDIEWLTTAGDSVIVQEEGERWSIDLTGLELPFGYVLVEPGYEEEVLVGLSLDSELETAVDEYFELEPRESAPRRRIAAHPEGSARLAWITFRGGLRSSRARARFARALHR